MKWKRGNGMWRSLHWTREHRVSRVACSFHAEAELHFHTLTLWRRAEGQIPDLASTSQKICAALNERVRGPVPLMPRTFAYIWSPLAASNVLYSYLLRRKTTKLGIRRNYVAI